MTIRQRIALTWLAFGAGAVAVCLCAPLIGSRSSEIVPSGNTQTHSPLCSAATAASNDPAASAVLRATGIWRMRRNAHPSPRLSKSSDLARKRALRYRRSARYASASGSRYET